MGAMKGGSTPATDAEAAVWPATETVLAHQASPVPQHNLHGQRAGRQAQVGAGRGIQFLSGSHAARAQHSVHASATRSLPGPYPPGAQR